MPAPKKRKRNTDDDYDDVVVLAPGEVQPARNWLLGFAYVNAEGKEEFQCMEEDQEHPGTTCGSTFLNDKHSHSCHKHKKHRKQALSGGGGGGSSSSGGRKMKQGPSRHETKSAKINVECKHCPGSKLTNPHSLIQHYRADKPKHGFKATEMEIFRDYPQLAYLLPAEKDKKDQKRKTSPEPKTRAAKKAKH
ncbi:hypothetical protein PG985_013110 [Apiospora marii]|uniref:C2H2-type domain-containing protein n=1 Tax=Apiospora marii TaxID=335849 RepID=A0ABR1R8R0_9PEZI